MERDISPTILISSGKLTQLLNIFQSIVDLPTTDGDCSVRKVLVYQRVVHQYTNSE
jgi:hypothetical protein